MYRPMPRPLILRPPAAGRGGRTRRSCVARRRAGPPEIEDRGLRRGRRRARRRRGGRARRGTAPRPWPIGRAPVAVTVQDERRWHVGVGVEHRRPLDVESDRRAGRRAAEQDVVERRVVAAEASTDQIGVPEHDHGGRDVRAEDGCRGGCEVAAVRTTDDRRRLIEHEPLATAHRRRSKDVVELATGGVAEVGPGEALAAPDAAAWVGQDDRVARPGERGGTCRRRSWSTGWPGRRGSPRLTGSDEHRRSARVSRRPSISVPSVDRQLRSSTRRSRCTARTSVSAGRHCPSPERVDDARRRTGPLHHARPPPAGFARHRRP